MNARSIDSFRVRAACKKIAVVDDVSTSCIVVLVGYGSGNSPESLSESEPDVTASCEQQRN